MFLEKDEKRILVKNVFNKKKGGKNVFTKVFLAKTFLTKNTFIFRR